MNTKTRTEHVYSYESKDGTRLYYVTFYYHDWTGKNVKKKKSGFKTQAAARQWEIDFRASIAGTSSMLFRDLFKQYMDSKTGTVKPNTIERETTTATLHILPTFGLMAINTITAKTIDNWQQENIKAGYAPSTIRLFRTILSSTFRYAIARGYLLNNPVSLAHSIRDNSLTPSDRARYWTQEQFARFITCGMMPKYIAFFSLLFWTGCRFGEACALRVCDINLEEGYIHITRTRSRYKGGYIFQSPKTKNGIRKVSIPTHLAMILADWIKRTGAKGNDLLFETHEVWATSAYMKKRAQALGIPPIRIHDLRHSHASMLIHLGVPAIAIRDRLGHASIKTTMDIYGHIYKDSGKDIAALLSHA